MTGRPVAEVAEDVHVVTLGRGTPASNVYLVRSGGSWVLIDAGWPGQEETIAAAAATVFGAGARPAAFLLTHIHPDHSGSAPGLARRWQLPVHVHPRELPAAAGRYVPEYGNPLDRGLIVPAMRLLPRRVRTRLEESGRMTDEVRPFDPDGPLPGLEDWVAVPTPGHTPGSTSFFRPADGLLVTGDAVVTVDMSLSGLLRPRRALSGPPWYSTWDAAAAARSVSTMAALRPAVLAPGHGRPWTQGTASGLRDLAAGLQASAEHAARRS
jgi:glyoxylase-like metal-dependent hydrolase (beta-lactamase superfamily II)